MFGQAGSAWAASQLNFGVSPHPTPAVRIVIPAHLCLVVLALGAGACAQAPPAAPADRRAALLDSLAGRYACAGLPFRVAADSARWRPAHACGVAGHALAVLAAAPAHEPYWAPGDTARVRAASVSQQQFCVLGPGEGRTDTASYVVALAVPERPYLLVARLNALSLDGEVAASPEDSPSPATLRVAPGNRTLAAPGAPCG
jgi:hypothetical protein